MSMALKYAMAKRAKKMAKGGDVSRANQMADGDGDMISRIMRKRCAEGGEAGEDSDGADFLPNEFDEEKLEPAPEASYEEDDDKRDIVSRIMRSRLKRDRTARPA